MNTYNLCLLGFGNVNRALVRLLLNRESELKQRYGIGWQITGIASRRLGWIVNPRGLDASLLSEARELTHKGLKGTDSVDNLRAWLQGAQAQVLFEATSLNVECGQPAIEHIRVALESGVHAITANKGPVVYAYEELRALGAERHKRFLFESTVMDGVPIFSLFRDHLPLVRLYAFHGILNSTTNVILGGMEDGLTFDQALAKAQAIGVAETDASHDVDGWDASVKVAALVTVLMGTRLLPQEVQREGIRNLTPAAVRGALAQGRRYKLVGRARRAGRSEGQVEATVRPELLSLDDPLAQVAGSSSIVHFETDIFPGLTITEHHPGLEATAYGMLADFIRAVTEERDPQNVVKGNL